MVPGSSGALVALPSHLILVVDDDAAIRGLVTVALSTDGYAVETAANGSEALGLVLDGQAPPNAILLDLRMPILTGWEFAEIYQAAPGPHARILVMTAATDAAACASGIVTVGILPKPFDIADVRSLVGQMVSRSSGAAAV